MEIFALIVVIYAWFSSHLFFTLIIYFLPLIIALLRKHNSAPLLGMLTFIFGWTGLIWFGLLLWSIFGDKVSDVSDGAATVMSEDEKEQYRKAREREEQARARMRDMYN
ncbi:superinfection immunity protein [Cronobacter muytjensii]|uniref:superinfection immunity protein n=1 Tax=Cronobacter muytjensii TaxID=413501 RepID=UPI002DBB6A21|nr:superinfection immunity protein [Cronobacter muytjensii]MEB8638669.1 superinfection immunity protein [Cronobacter muytjensii]